MILLLLSMLINSNLVQADMQGDPPTPPLRYILDVPEVKSALLEVNRGCLARRSTKICDCFMKNFKRKVNGRDIIEKDMPLLVDVAYRRKELQNANNSQYFFIKDMMEIIESECTADQNFEMDLGGDEITKNAPARKNNKAPASTPKTPK